MAEHLGLPFVSVAAALPVNLDPSVPPVRINLPWRLRVGTGARLRNRLGNTACEWTFSGVVRTVNRQHRAWGLPAARGMNNTLRGSALVAQLPVALELPGRGLPHGFRRTGPWTDPGTAGPGQAPWWRV